ncbi:hypothetical protein [Mucilaginibacter pedocola]|uniref:Uncharacterized protein n=1 Tax=Mucilaginibacter pedocola TaxID=1792845 RepID=A0A1S9PF38_9SPHI|nr:hypothetical protein [Mucilaginibacter pedocola]OOQ59583.1 hypothetical protein BC343_05300 [Mucilaginibacter pedocola]
MESVAEKYDRANGQGKNHDGAGNVANVGNDTLKQNINDPDKAKEIPTVVPFNDNPELEDPQPQNASNKGQGPAGENL